MLLNVWKNRKILFELAKNDFKKKYVTSYLGILWGFIPSIMTIIVYWFVFSVGFKSEPVNNVPYLLWLMCGLIPWFFFSDGLAMGVNSFVEYAYLVKKMVFPIEILPFVKVLSALFVHIFFLLLNIVVFLLYDIGPTIQWIQILYYLFALTCLVSVICFLGATINVFFRDFGHIVMVLLQVLVWLTPIIWGENQFDEAIIEKLKINPVFYIVRGYRESFMGEQWFWEDMNYTIYFWVFVAILYVLGIFSYKKLRGHFSDLL